MSTNNRNSRSTLTTIRTLGGVSDRARVTLRYVEEFSISTATVASSSYVFTGNDPFDPNYTSTGTQPANFDDYAALYTRYRCFGSKIRVYPAVEVDSTDDGIRLAVGPRHTTTDLTTHSLQNNFIAQPYVSFNVLSYYNTKVKDGLIELPYMSTAKYLGLSQAEFLGQDDLTALTTASPAHRWFWHITQSNANTANTNVCFYTAIIDYNLEFWDRVDTTLDLDAQIKRLEQMRDRDGVHVSKPVSVTFPERKESKRGIL